MMPALTLAHTEFADRSDHRAATAAFHLDADRMTAIVHDRWASLVRLATLLLSDRAVAEEVVQEACESVWRRRPDVASAEHLGAYLRSSVVNGARSAGRRRGTAARNLTRLHAEHRADVEAPADAGLLLQEDRRLVREALAALPERQREVLVLRYWARLSEAEIADTLDIAAGTVKSTAHHALAALRARLAADDSPKERS